MADTSIPPISSSTSAASNPNAVPLLPASQQLGQKDFLKLLVAQLSAQDPLNPQTDTQFIGQMAQFAALQNSQSLDTDMQTLRANQLLGQTVQVKIDDQHNANGVVTGIDTSTGTPKILVGNNAFDLSDIVRVIQPQTAGAQGSTARPPVATSTTANRGYAPS